MTKPWIPHKWVSQTKNRPRRISAGVQVGEKYKGPDGRVLLIEEMCGGLIAVDLETMQTEFIGSIDWSKMELVE